MLKVRENLSAVKRGDANIDGVLDFSDALVLINHLFLGGPAPDCPVAADFNLDSALDLSDPIAILNTLFHGKPPAGSLEPATVPCR